MGGFALLNTSKPIESGADLNSEEAFCGLFTERVTPDLMPERMMVPQDWLEDGAVPMWEFVSDYHNWWRGPSGGRGASYGRGSLLNSIRDILKAYGNPLYEPNTEIPWAAPGVTQAWLDLSSAERCENPVTLEGFYNAEYNPEGEYPVITFCEGDHSDDAQSPEIVGENYGDGTNRPQAFLAVDINHNGVRDYGEPVIHTSGAIR